MAETVAKIRFQESNLYASISKEVAEYAFKSNLEIAYRLNFDEIRGDLTEYQRNTKKLFHESAEHIYSKSDIEEAAAAEVRHKLKLRRIYFSPYASNNIGEKIAAYYANKIIEKLEVYKRAVRIWHRQNKIALPAAVRVTCGKAYAEIDFASRMSMENNLQEIFSRYIDEKILDKGCYADAFDENDIEVNFEDYIPPQNFDLSPFEEKMKKLLGMYTAWLYTCDTSALDDKVDMAVKRCARDVFRSGYLQEATHKLLSGFIDALQGREAA